jgi:hypothetical protein
MPTIAGERLRGRPGARGQRPHTRVRQIGRQPLAPGRCRWVYGRGNRKAMRRDPRFLRQRLYM